MLNHLILLLLSFQFKHFICDFPLQVWPYMYANKSKYGHPGGLLHAWVHGVGTFLIVVIFHLPWWIILIDMIVHYHIDLVKMKINAYYGWKPESSSEFWILLGIDQLLHQLTYILLIWIALRSHIFTTLI